MQDAVKKMQRKGIQVITVIQKSGGSFKSNTVSEVKQAVRRNNYESAFLQRGTRAKKPRLRESFAGCEDEQQFG